MARNQLFLALKPIQKLIASLGPPIAFRKLNGILAALEIQVEDGHFQRHAVARLCEALLATRELYEIGEDATDRLEQLVCKVIELAESRSLNT